MAIDVQLAVVVERMRAALGLLPWIDRAAQAEQEGYPPPRRSGRTTLGILTAIARARRDGASKIVVMARPARATEDCVAAGRDLLRRLLLDDRIELVEDRGHDARHPAHFVRYIDHTMREAPLIARRFCAICAEDVAEIGGEADHRMTCPGPEGRGRA